MRLQVKGKNVEVTAAIREYAEAKLSKLAKQLADQTQVELELSQERNPSISQNQVAEATVWTKGPTLRARESSSDMKASIDQLADKLSRQVKRYREKQRRRPSRTDAAEAPMIPSDESGQLIVKTKQFAIKPMTAEEAVLQLELVGHDFFLFKAADSGSINVVYRRRSGGYGLIDPQV